MTKPFGSIFLDDRTYEEKIKEHFINLMKSSKTEKEWNKNKKIVKDEYSGYYPSWWHQEIYDSGLEKRIWSKFND